jgi:hypothetical protein
MIQTLIQRYPAELLVVAIAIIAILAIALTILIFLYKKLRREIETRRKHLKYYKTQLGEALADRC